MFLLCTRREVNMAKKDQVPADAVSKHGPSGNPVIVASYVPANCVENADALIASGYLKIVPIIQQDWNPSRRQ
jgi:hypothetical protein